MFISCISLTLSSPLSRLLLCMVMHFSVSAIPIAYSSLFACVMEDNSLSHGLILQYERHIPLSVCCLLIAYLHQSCCTRTRQPQFLSPRTTACISDRASCTRLVFAYIVALFQCFRMVPVSWSSGGGEQERATKNRTPLARGTIEPSINNGFPTRSGKRLQLEMLDLDSRVIGL